MWLINSSLVYFLQKNLSVYCCSSMTHILLEAPYNYLTINFYCCEGENPIDYFHKFTKYYKQCIKNHTYDT